MGLLSARPIASWAAVISSMSYVKELTNLFPINQNATFIQNLE